MEWLLSLLMGPRPGVSPEVRGRGRALELAAANRDTQARLRQLIQQRQQNASRLQRVRSREQQQPRSVMEKFGDAHYR